jgi:hypothetical protein
MNNKHPRDLDRQVCGSLPVPVANHRREYAIINRGKISMKKSSVVLLLVAIAMAPAVGLGQVIIRGTEIPSEAPAN